MPGGGGSLCSEDEQVWLCLGAGAGDGVIVQWDPMSGVSLCGEVRCIMGDGRIGPHRHDWKYYLPATSLASRLLITPLRELKYWWIKTIRMMQISTRSMISGGSKGAVRDAPPGFKFFQFHAVFWENFAKSNVGAPTLGKSWIRHWWWPIFL